MPNFEMISDEKITECIDALIRGRTLVKVAVPGVYEQLTVIIDAKKAGGGACFQIDPPDGLLEAITNSPRPILFFEFSNEDRLPHRFEASIKETTKEIWLWYPIHIQRYQLRSNFRIKAPANAQATTLIEETKVMMVVENISLGGIFCHCPNIHKDLISLGLKSGRMDLTFSFGGACLMVTIGRTIVRRVEGRTIAKHFGVAFEFLHMKTEAKKRLTQIVYDMQREYLRNRYRNDL